MTLKPLILLTAALLSSAGPACAELPEGSLLRIRDCVPTNDVSLKNMRALRDTVRAAFARQGGAASTGPWTDSWQWAWDRADDWVPVVGDEGVVGLDSKIGNMAALIPRGWTSGAGGYDPVAEMEAARGRLAGWTDAYVPGFWMHHPRDWSVRVSSPSDLTTSGGHEGRLWIGGSGTAEMSLKVWESGAEPGQVALYERSVGEAALEGFSLIERTPPGWAGIELNGRNCRAAYLERKSWSEPDADSFEARTVLGCRYPAVHDDLLIVIETSEYRGAGGRDADALAGYQTAVRAVCTLIMTPGR